MYKDKDKQREANRQAAKKYRDSMTGKGMTVIPKTDIRVIPKRGLDIKCFEDLPPDVQVGILHMSRDETGKTNTVEKAKRTARAIQYQHTFPDSFQGRGAGSEST